MLLYFCGPPGIGFPSSRAQARLARLTFGTARAKHRWAGIGVTDEYHRRGAVRRNRRC